MKIVRELADCLRARGRLSEEDHARILDLLMGHARQPDRSVERGRWDLDDEGPGPETATDWWRLRVVGERPSVKRVRAARRARSKPGIKVWDLEPLLPKRLSDGAAFPLAELLRETAAEAGLAVPAGWKGFVLAVRHLYGLGAEDLHRALRAVFCGRDARAPEILAEAEQGATLFPADFLDDIDGVSVWALKRWTRGQEDRYLQGKGDWLLKYPNFCVLHMACLVRNRLRRIYRFWVANCSEEERRQPNDVRPKRWVLNFGKVRVPVPRLVCEDLGLLPPPGPDFEVVEAEAHAVRADALLVLPGWGSLRADWRRFMERYEGYFNIYNLSRAVCAVRTPPGCDVLHIPPEMCDRLPAWMLVRGFFHWLDYEVLVQALAGGGARSGEGAIECLAGTFRMVLKQAFKCGARTLAVPCLVPPPSQGLLSAAFPKDTEELVDAWVGRLVERLASEARRHVRANGWPRVVFCYSYGWGRAGFLRSTYSFSAVDWTLDNWAHAAWRSALTRLRDA